MAFTSDNYFSGKNGKCTVAGTDINIKSWSVSPEVDEHDASGTRAAGFGAYITGIKRATFSVTLNWDAAANPLDNPPNLAIGSEVSTVKLFLDGTSSPFWSFPQALVISTPMTSGVGDGPTEITINCRADGTFSAPTGNFTPA